MKYLPLDAVGTGRVGYQQQVKEANIKRIFDLVRSGKCKSRAELVRMMQLSATSVSLTSDAIVAVTATNYYDKNERDDTVHDSVTVNKLDENNTALDGAVFTLYQTKDANDALSDPVRTYGGSGVSSFNISTEDAALASLLPTTDGGSVTLYLKETTAPTGYVLSDTIHNVLITTTISDPTLTGNVYVTTTTYTMTINGDETKDIPNTPDTDTDRVDNSVTIYKTDGTNPLAGATFKLYDGTTEVKTYYGADATLYTISTADDDLAGVLPAAGATKTLTLKETTAPAGYNKSNTEYSVVISASESTAWNNDHTKKVTTTTYAISIGGEASATVPNTPQVGSVTFTQEKTFKNGTAATEFGYTITEYTDNTYATVMRFESKGSYYTSGRGYELNYNVNSPHYDYACSSFKWFIVDGEITLLYDDDIWTPIYITRYSLGSSWFRGQLVTPYKSIGFEFENVAYSDWDYYRNGHYGNYGDFGDPRYYHSRTAPSDIEEVPFLDRTDIAREKSGDPEAFSVASGEFAKAIRERAGK